MGVLKEVHGKNLDVNIIKKIEEAVNNAPKNALAEKSIEEYYHYKSTCSIINPKNHCITYAKKLKFLQKSRYIDENCVILIPSVFKEQPEFTNLQKRFHNALFVPVADPFLTFLDIWGTRIPLFQLLIEMQNPLLKF